MSSKALNALAQAAAEAGLNQAQKRAFMATSKVESGYNPSAVGDGGTSFGLFQHHIGGAGGATRESAMRYLDPLASARERAKWFKKNNITSGRGAAALQRPADPSGYARKVDAAMRGVDPGLNAPVQGGAPTQQQAQQRPGAGGSKLFDMMFSDDPVMMQLAGIRRNRLAAQQQPATPVEQALAEGAVDQTALSNYKDIQRWARQLAGATVQGSFQTTGGGHAKGSLHYAGKAVDFGDANTNRGQFNKLAAYAKANPGKFKQFYYNPLGWGIQDGKVVKGLSEKGHDDHMHIGVF